MPVTRFALVLLFLAASAFAQNNRSFVSTAGSDSNDCTAGHECRSFARALSVTNYGGEVLALTSGGYGPFTVTQAVSVISATGSASITAPSVSDAVTISGFDGDRILLRGLNITLSGTVGTGIVGSSYGLLTIDHCTVTGGSGGITLTGDSLSRAVVTDTDVLATAGTAFFSNSRAVLKNCSAQKNSGDGIAVQDPGKVTITGFTSVGNQHGASSIAVNSSGGVSVLHIDRSVFSDNTSDGIFCSVAGGLVAYVFLGNSVVTDNIGHGLNNNGTFFSMKNNLVADNQGGDINGTIQQLTAQ